MSLNKRKMYFNPIIPPKNENRWTAFLNGEPDITDVSNSEAVENADFTAVWEAAGNNFSYNAADPDEAWTDLQNKMSDSDHDLRGKVFKYLLFKYAAMIVLVMGIGFLTYKIVNVPEKQSDESVRMVLAQSDAHPVALTIVTFPDGSTAKMNASTRIEYPDNFSANIRKVKLSGEAFFEVARDTARPFIIETEKASVEVLGTTFNVAAYPSSTLVEVNVETGKVVLRQPAEGSSVAQSAILHAGEHGWLNLTDNKIGYSAGLAPNYSAWITKQISFQRTPLSEAFSVLENTYHVKIRMESSEIGRIPYTANFADLKLDYVIDVIARTHKLKVKRSGDEIIVARAKN